MMTGRFSVKDMIIMKILVTGTRNMESLNIEEKVRASDNTLFLDIACYILLLGCGDLYK